MRWIWLAGGLFVATACASSRRSLDPALVVRAAGMVEPGQRWAPAFARLRLVLGAPTFADGAAFAWAALAGDDCYLIEVRVVDGVIAFVDDPARVRWPRLPDPFAYCAQRAHR